MAIQMSNECGMCSKKMKFVFMEESRRKPGGVPAVRLSTQNTTQHRTNPCKHLGAGEECPRARNRCQVLALESTV